ncbi:hypothetical protein [Caballeronia sp. LZ035]|uniref:hypothetical protein n=1 Tax=Caballeronia sp. LZ035 TaxID=3038568 RepID=UPI002857E89E|nr:hypothetical protein [Caballeronia sp. LZ035]MDR5758741.1 hypothetical protein [Caballeronia sp. LZ035]
MNKMTGGHAAGLYVVAATLVLSAIITLLLARRQGGPDMHAAGTASGSTPR